MFPLPQFQGKTVGVLGLGPNGAAVATSLAASGARVIAWDGDETARTLTDALCAPPRTWPLAEMSAVILSDGQRKGLSVALVEKARAHKVDIFTDLDLFGSAIAALDENERPRIVAVTGMAGKSVTVSIIRHILLEQGRDVAVGGQNGHPFMDMPAPHAGMTYLLELPVRRMSTARHFHSDVSVVLNVSADPFQSHVDLALKSLLRIFKTQGEDDTAIIGVDDVLGQKLCTMLRSSQFSATHKGSIVPVSGETSLGHGVFALDGAAYSAQSGKSHLLGNFARATAFVGPHLNQDAAAAMATCLTLGIDASMIIKALHSYHGLEGRFECLGSAGSLVFIDDAFASCPTAAIRAIHACPDVFWIGGAPTVVDNVAQLPGISQSVHGSYLVSDTEAPSKDQNHHTNLKAAVDAAVKDARELVENDPSASPVILFAPGLPAAKASFNRLEFRHLAADYIEETARYA